MTIEITDVIVPITGVPYAVHAGDVGELSDAVEEIIPEATATVGGRLSDAQAIKLNGIEAGALAATAVGVIAAGAVSGIPDATVSVKGLMTTTQVTALGATQTAEQCGSIAQGKVDAIPDGTPLVKGLLTTANATKLSLVPTITEYSGTIAAGAATPTIATIAVAASTNVAAEANVVAHAYGGRKSSGCLQWRGSRNGSSALVEDGQSMVGVWDTSPADNAWDPRFEVSSNNVLLKITSDPSVQISYRCRVSSEAIDTSADPEPSWVALRAVAIAACAAAGGWAIDAEHVTIDPTKAGYASAALDFVGTKVFTRPIDNTWDPQVTTTSEGYACFRPVGAQGFEITETLAQDGSTGCRLIAVIKPKTSAVYGTLLDNVDSIFIGTQYSSSSTGPYITSNGTLLATSDPTDLLQLLEFRFQYADATKNIIRNNAAVPMGSSYWNRTFSMVAPHLLHSGHSSGIRGCEDDVVELWWFPRCVAGDLTALVAYVKARYSELAGIPS
jgi:hypothetical protein